MSFKPKGYTSVAPYVIVANARAHLRFLDQVFRGERLRFIERDDGSVQHAEYRIDDTIIMFGEAPVSGDIAAHLHVYCPDPDAVFARALDAGADVVQALSDQGDGDRRGGFAGPAGAVWWVARQNA